MFFFFISICFGSPGSLLGSPLKNPVVFLSPLVIQFNQATPAGTKTPVKELISNIKKLSITCPIKTNHYGILNRTPVN